MATVVRLKRSGGKIVQDCDVYIGRRLTMGGWDLKESIWANPYSIKELKLKHPSWSDDKLRRKIIEKYKWYLLNSPELMKRLPELKGKVLGCWCSPKRCHGDVLLDLIERPARFVIIST